MRSHIRRLLALAWLGSLWVFCLAVLVPWSTTLTRAGSVLGLGASWLLSLFIYWKRQAIWWTLLLLLAASVALLLAPARANRDPELLRRSMITLLRSYEGKRYVGGGESEGGIDCSGLARRGIVEALWTNGVLHWDGDWLRRGVDIWWHDCTAEQLGTAYRGYLRTLFSTPDLNHLDPARILPGDLAVTVSGLHVLIYLGDRTWIEADPAQRQVIIVPVPSTEVLWMAEPMTISRWRVLER